jgi:putative CocE/NonD family hydrolase
VSRAANPVRAMFVAATAVVLATLAVAAPEPAAVTHLEGVHASGAHWAIDMPARWNGTLLLYARGYSPRQPDGAPETAPRGVGAALLAQGYALAASNYSGGGWALEEAPGDQIDVLDIFRQRYARPHRTIAWGVSMGGLTTLAVAERFPGRIDGALSLCGSVSGSLGMLNTALDGAFAFRTLLAPDSDIRLVHVDDDLLNGARVRRVLDAALRTPQGRARVALAATLAQLPPWTVPTAPEPAARDFAAQAEQQYQAFVLGVFLPRIDQEQRAGGVYSWNTGVDYRVQLRRSGRRAFVQALYRAAGLDLERDLATLAAAPRIAADPQAVAYMRANYVPAGRLQLPVLTLQTIGDGMTVPATHGSLAAIVSAAGRRQQLAQIYVRGAGHCAFNPAEQLTALHALERRLTTGDWDVSVTSLQRLAGDQSGAVRFTVYRAPALLRSCGAQPGSCAGEPALPTTRLDSASIDGYVRASQYVRVRDGTRLAVALFRPATGGAARRERLPVVLVHSLGPRPRELGVRTADLGVEQLVRRGYVVAWMEPRGNGASFGAATPFLTRQNGRDAADVVEWLAAQPWASGRVAMYGLSNLGYIQWLTAIERPPHLVAIAPAVANPNFYYQLYPNGVSALAGAPTRAGPGPRGEPVDQDRAPGFALNAAAYVEHTGNLALGNEWLPNMTRDQVNPQLGYAPGREDSVLPAHAAAVRAAGLQIFQHAGWFDASPGGQLAAWKAFGGRITIGAWRHGLYAAAEGGERIRAELFPWFDHVLKGLPAPRDAALPIHYQTINASGAQAWHYAAGWPLPNQRLTSYFLHTGTHALAPQRAAALAAAADSYRVNPDIEAFDGKFNRLGRVWDGDMAPGVDARGVSYTSAPLTADTEVTGHPVAHLWLSADAPDFNVLMYLEEVDAAGHSRFVTDGVMRASHRQLEARSPWRELGVPFHPSTSDSLQPLSPGVPVELVFDLNPTSWLFQRGSRLRVTITGGERRTYEQPASFNAASPPEWKIYGAGKWGSYVSLPLIPAH